MHTIPANQYSMYDFNMIDEYGEEDGLYEPYYDEYYDEVDGLEEDALYQ